MSQILQMWENDDINMKPEKKQIKCNIITQAYRSRCSSQTHPVIKTFRIVQQGEVSLLRVLICENDDFRFIFVERRISQPQPNKQASQE